MGHGFGERAEHGRLPDTRAERRLVRAVVREGYGISRVEATWAGLPVVATRAGETRGMLLYDFGDVEGLARQLKSALFAPPRGEVGRWAEQFRLEAEENLRALEKVLGLEPGREELR